MSALAHTVTVTELDDGGRALLAQGDILEFDLYENPATGFRWRLDIEQPALFSALEDDFQIYSSAVGGGGRVHLRLRCVAPGISRVTALCARSWQLAAADAQRVAVAVEIKAGQA